MSSIYDYGMFEVERCSNTEGYKEAYAKLLESAESYDCTAEHTKPFDFVSAVYICPSFFAYSNINGYDTSKKAYYENNGYTCEKLQAYQSVEGRSTHVTMKEMYYCKKGDVTDATIEINIIVDKCGVDAVLPVDL